MDRAAGTVTDFIARFNKPIDVKFRASNMFIADFGTFTPGAGQVWMVAPSH